jgi:hypothetical protein
MATAASRAIIEWPDWLDERAESEMTPKGHLSGLIVRLDDGSRYELNFINPVRLGQELTMDARAGTPYFAEPGLVVIPEVTLPAVRSTVERLAAVGFFRLLKPLASPTA